MISVFTIPTRRFLFNSFVTHNPKQNTQHIARERHSKRERKPLDECIWQICFWIFFFFCLSFYSPYTEFCFIARRKWIAHKWIKWGIIIIIIIIFFSYFPFRKKSRNLCVTRLRFVMHISLSLFLFLTYKVKSSPDTIVTRLAYVVSSLLLFHSFYLLFFLLVAIHLLTLLSLYAFFQRPAESVFFFLSFSFALCHWQRTSLTRCVYLYI